MCYHCLLSNHMCTTYVYVSKINKKLILLLLLYYLLIHCKSPSPCVVSLLHLSQSSLLVSICDKTHNAYSIINDYDRIGKKLWKRFKANTTKIYWYYKNLLKCYNKNLRGNKVLKQNFKYLVSLIKKIAKDKTTKRKH